MADKLGTAPTGKDPRPKRSAREKSPDTTGLDATLHAALLSKQELRVTPAEPHILAPLSKIKELEAASNTAATSVWTLCLGAMFSAGPLAVDAIDKMSGKTPEVPSGEARYQLYIFLPAVALFVASSFFVIPRLGRFGHKLRELQRGKRFLWNEVNNQTSPLPSDGPPLTLWERLKRRLDAIIEKI